MYTLEQLISFGNYVTGKNIAQVNGDVVTAWIDSDKEKNSPAGDKATEEQQG